MQTKFISDNTRQTEAIKSLYKSAKKIRCAVAFWGKGAPSIFTGKINDTKLICNLTSGGTNPFVIKTLIKRKFKIRQNSNLHAKVFWTEQGVLLGSSNFSSNGLDLGTANIGNDEANVLISDPNLIKGVEAWFNKQWEKAKKITTEEITEEIRRWKIRQKERATEQHKGHILTRLKNNSITDEEANFLFYETSADLTDKDVEKFVSESKLAVPKNYSWWQESNPDDSPTVRSNIRKMQKAWCKYPPSICIPLNKKDRPDITTTKEKIHVSKIISTGKKCEIILNEKPILVSIVQSIENTELTGAKLDNKLISILNKSIKVNSEHWNQIRSKSKKQGGYVKISVVKKMLKNYL